jgi:hypothetical protein
VLLVSIGYFGWATWARWRFVARPNRRQLLADLGDLVALTVRTQAGVSAGVQQDSINAIKELLGPTLESDKSVEGMLRKPGLWNDSTWSGEMDEEALGKITAAQAYVPNLLSNEEVVARLIVARGWLKSTAPRPSLLHLDRKSTPLSASRLLLPPRSIGRAGCFGI